MKFQFIVILIFLFTLKIPHAFFSRYNGEYCCSFFLNVVPHVEIVVSLFILFHMLKLFSHPESSRQESRIVFQSRPRGVERSPKTGRSNSVWLVYQIPKEQQKREKIISVQWLSSFRRTQAKDSHFSFIDRPGLWWWWWCKFKW